MSTDPLAPTRHAGYERQDASTRGLFIFFIVMAIALVLTALGVAWLFGHFERTARPAPFLGPPFGSVRPVPAAPLLQAQPGDEIQEYRTQQQQILNSYAWIDRNNGVLRIPIDQAMQLLLQRGLPARPAQGSPNGTAEQESGNPAAPETGGSGSEVQK